MEGQGGPTLSCDSSCWSGCLEWLVPCPLRSPAKPKAPKDQGWHPTLCRAFVASKGQEDCAGLMLWCSQLPLKTASAPKCQPHLYKARSQEQGSALVPCERPYSPVQTTQASPHGTQAAQVVFKWLSEWAWLCASETLFTDTGNVYFISFSPLARYYPLESPPSPHLFKV